MERVNLAKFLDQDSIALSRGQKLADEGKNTVREFYKRTVTAMPNLYDHEIIGEFKKELGITPEIEKAQTKEDKYAYRLLLSSLRGHLSQRVDGDVIYNKLTKPVRLVPGYDMADPKMQDRYDEEHQNPKKDHQILVGYEMNKGIATREQRDTIAAIILRNFSVGIIENYLENNNKNNNFYTFNEVVSHILRQTSGKYETDKELLKFDADSIAWKIKDLYNEEEDKPSVIQVLQNSKQVRTVVSSAQKIAAAILPVFFH